MERFRIEMVVSGFLMHSYYLTSSLKVNGGSDADLSFLGGHVYCPCAIHFIGRFGRLVTLSVHFTERIEHALFPKRDWFLTTIF